MLRDFAVIGPVLPSRLATSPLFGVLSAAAIGGLTLIEPRSLDGRARTVHRLTTAAVTGAYTGATLPLGLPGGRLVGTAVGLAVGGATFALADASERLDARAVDWLAGHGVRHPRAWLAGVGAFGVAVGWAADRAEQRTLDRQLEEAGEPEVGPAEPAVVAVVEALLTPQVPGTEALRRQLTGLQQQWWDSERGFSTDSVLVPTEDSPRVAPRTQLWPVRGRFTRDGVDFEVDLQIHGGRIESLAILVAEDMYSVEAAEVGDGESGVDFDEAIAGLTAWPSPEELVLTVDAPDPL